MEDAISKRLVLIVILLVAIPASMLVLTLGIFPSDGEGGEIAKLAWRRTGGFLGLNEELVIRTDGSASYTSDLFGDAELVLDEAEVEELLDKTSSFTTDIAYSARASAADYFVYSLAVQTASGARMVEWVDDWAAEEAIPRELLELQSHIEAVIEGIHEITGASDDAVDRAIQIARDFIIRAPTFRFDGIPETLNVTKVSILESLPLQYVITIDFESRHAGYGDRTGQALPGVITPHTAVVKVVRDNVVSAILDNQWDEVNREPLENDYGLG